ncbi:MAG: phosphodiester glycosidase family protein [Leptolyngbyaceae cyanobacterium SM2_5_2]|nr:phosphodiester glycosidase family protein [Leptolyngbyaceae cyanobacterium SM2_5_2]
MFLKTHWLLPALSGGLITALGLSGCGSDLPGSATVNQTVNQVESSAVTATDPPLPVYETIVLPRAVVHVVTIPDPVNYPVRVAVADELAPVEQLASQVCATEGCAVAAINAGFFDPNNGLTTSYGVVDGSLVADPSQNERLMGNPALTPYLDRILNRSEFRRYTCGGVPRYEITRHRAPSPPGCALEDAVGAGPQLLPQDTSVDEGFLDPATTPVRDALGSQSANARSAIGLKADGSLVLVLVAQVPDMPSGMTLPELSTFMAEQGVVQALNLDGGSSTTLVYGRTVHHGRRDPAGEVIQRPVKSILWVGGQ